MIDATLPTFKIGKPDRRGRSKVRAIVGGEHVYTNTIDAHDPSERQAFVAQLCASVPSVQQDSATLNRELAAAADTSSGATVERFEPFPAQTLPQPLRRFVTAGAKSIGCDPVYVALPMLVALAAAIGNTRRLRLSNTWHVPSILWAAIVGESGEKKSPGFRLVTKPLHKRHKRAMQRHAEGMQRFETDLATYEKDMAEWKREKNRAAEPPQRPDPPRAERCIVSDTTVEALAPLLLENPRGLMLIRDELAGWLGSFDRYAAKGKAGSDSANWLSMFNAEPVTVDRKTGTPRHIYVPHAAVSVVGGIQPAILNRALGQQHREDGLAARLLLVCPPSRATLWTEADIDPNVERRFAEVVDRLYELEPATDGDGEPMPELVGLTSEAKAAWVACHDEHVREMAELTGELRAAWSKLTETPARLALVLHFARWAAGDPKMGNAKLVDVDTMTAAIRLRDWFKREARRVYAMLGETDEDRERRRLLEWIDGRGGRVTARDVQQGCRWLKKPGEAEAALAEAVKAGDGVWAPTPAGQRGQPTRYFVLSTVSTVYANSETPEENGNTVDVDSVDGSDDEVVEWSA